MYWKPPSHIQMKNYNRCKYLKILAKMKKQGLKVEDMPDDVARRAWLFGFCELTALENSWKTN